MLMVSVAVMEQVSRTIHQERTIKLLRINRNLHATLANYRI